jgi:putative aldouronate transport system substrate-binding protein
MKLKMFRRIMSVLVLLAMVFITACGSSAVKNDAASSVDAGTTKAEESTTAEAIDPTAKYEPAIDLTAGRSSNSSYKFVDGESFDNNIWITEYKDVLGINLKHSFVVDESQYDAKVNVAIASGDIPDVMMVTAKQTKMLMEADLIHEISDVFDNYASPMTKNAVMSDEKAFSASKIEGKLMGIPMLWAIDFQVPMIWIRSDWMKKLNLSEPKTADDVLKIAEAFVNQDPDGNGKKDTLGISLDKGLGGGVGDFRGWINMFHAYKGIWQKDASGSLVYSSIQPEMRAALQKMAELYKNGIIDREFAVKDGGKIAQDVVAEKAGIQVGLFWNPAWPLQDLKNKNAASDWTPYPLLSADDKPALAQVNVKVDQFYVISKKCTHPEALIKLANLQFDNLYGSRMGQWEKVSQSDKYKALQTFKYPIIGMEPPTYNRDIFTEVQAAIESNDGSKLIYTASKEDWEKGNQFLKGDMKGWNNQKIRWEKNGSMGVIINVLNNKALMYNENYGVPGPVAVEKTSTMDKLENETFTKIIMNAAPIDDFDKFIGQWKKTGGDDLTKEVNDWYAKNK